VTGTCLRASGAVPHAALGDRTVVRRRLAVLVGAAG